MVFHDLPIKYLANTKIDEKGQLRIPKQVLEEIGMRLGTPFTMLRLGDALLLPQPEQFEKLYQKDEPEPH